MALSIARTCTHLCSILLEYMGFQGFLRLPQAVELLLLLPLDSGSVCMCRTLYCPASDHFCHREHRTQQRDIQQACAPCMIHGRNRSSIEANHVRGMLLAQWHATHCFQASDNDVLPSGAQTLVSCSASMHIEHPHAQLRAYLGDTVAVLDCSLRDLTALAPCSMSKRLYTHICQKELSF